LNQ
jgi:hypothetical protein